MKPIKITTILALSPALLPFGANAAIVALFNFNNTSDHYADSAGFADATVSDWTTAIPGGNTAPTNNDANGLYANTIASQLNNTAAAFDGYSWGGNRNDQLGFSREVTHATSIARQEYISFNVTADNGNAVDLGKLQWQMRIANVTESPNSWGVFFSKDDFVGTPPVAGQEFATGTITTTGSYQLQTADLSGSATLAAGETGYIRIYLYDGRNNGSSTTYFDNFTLYTVPEPSAAALLGLGLFGLLARRRRA